MSFDHIRILEKVAIRPGPVLIPKNGSEAHALFLDENPTEAMGLSEKIIAPRTFGREEELRQFDSQEFLGLVKYNSNGNDSAKRAKEYLKDFKKSVHSDGKNLEGNVNHERAQLSSQEVEFSRRFRMAHSSVLYSISAGRALAVHSSPLSSNSNNSLYKRSAEVLNSATSLAEHLQRSYSDLDDPKALFIANTDWQVDFHKMKCIFDGGRKVGEQKVENILTNSNKTQLCPQKDELSHQLFDKCARLTSDLTWYETVRKQEKAVMRLVDTLLLE